MKSRAIRYSEYIFILLILALAAYLRLHNITDNPGWYTDEGTNLDVALHLAHGQLQYMALGQSTLLVSRLVVFEGILAILLNTFGGGMTTLRLFTAVSGIVSVGLLYVTVRRIGKQYTVLALLAALMFAIYPQAVLYSRFGFSYNLLDILLLLALIGLLDYVATKHRIGLTFAAICIGLGTISDVWMLSMILPFVILVIVFRPRDLFWSLPLVVAPFVVYCVVMLLTVPDAFLFDLRFVLFRVSNLSLPEQIQNVALNYTTLIAQDGSMLAGVVGLFLLRPARLRLLILLFFFVPLVFLGRTIALYSLSFYYMIPLLPLVSLGVATLLYYGVGYLWRITHDDIAAILARFQLPDRLQHIVTVIGVSGVIVFVAIVPLMISLGLTMNEVEKGFPTAIDPVLIRGEDAVRVAQFVNTHASADDLVIASPTVAWQLQTRTADFQMAIVATGQATPHFPATLPLSRFVYDPRLEHARYVIIDNLWRNWAAINVPGVTDMIREVETWPLAFESGAIEVYEQRSST